MSAYGFPDTALLGKVDSNHFEADSIPAGVATMAPGDLVFTYAGENVAYPYLADTAKTVFSGDFVTSNTIDGVINGENMAQVTFATDHATTMGLVIAALNAMDGVEAVLDSTDSNGRTILIRLKGVASFTVDFTVAAGASQATDSSTYASGQLFRGVARYVTRVPTTVGGTGLFALNESITTIRLADIWAASASGMVAGDIAYVATTGKFGASGVDVGARVIGAYDSTAVGSLVRLPAAAAPMTYGDRF